MARRKTRTEAEIEARLKALSPDSERYKVLTVAKAFRASWVGFGEILTAVREQELYKAWGYTSFDLYCRRELNLKRDTANKLTRSYAFLRDHQPNMLATGADDGGAEPVALPPLDVVDMLSQARERSNLSEAQFTAIQEEVLGSEAPPATRQQVVKRFREVDPEAFRGAAPKKDTAAAAGPGDNDLRKALLLAERLETICQGLGGVSPTVVQGLQAAVVELRDKFAASRTAISPPEDPTEPVEIGAGAL